MMGWLIDGGWQVMLLAAGAIAWLVDRTRQRRKGRDDERIQQIKRAADAQARMGDVDRPGDRGERIDRLRQHGL